MEIRDLSTTDLEEVVFAILMAFEGYFLTMPSDVDYWKNRFQAARVNWFCSFGMFEGETLVGFIINGIDCHGKEKVAFNTGTGVVPKYRGQKIVDQLYEYAFPILKSETVTTCALEVIQENRRAVRVYERIGFSITKEYQCFKGKLATSSYQVTIEKLAFEQIKSTYTNTYAWDNTNQAINASVEGTYTCYEVVSLTQQKLGFFVLNAQSGYLAQFEIYKPDQKKDWELLFDGIAQINRMVRINNVDAQQKDIIEALVQVGLKNTINQYEMERKL